MYTPSVLTTPLVATGPADPSAPARCLTGNWAFTEGELEIGIWECTPGALAGPLVDEDEAMFMVAGRATVHHDGGTFDLAPGTLWTTPPQWPCRWDVHQTVRKMYVIDHRPPTPGEPALLANAYAVELPDGTPRPVVISGSPVESSLSIWSHDRFDVGVWECTPGEFPFRRDGYQEVFTVLSGRATLEVDGAEGGTCQRFELVPGAMILTPSGTTGRWIVHETIRKAYVTVTD
ncbi:MAG: cupin domain-containing protein [Acidimicrobiales bacterium]